MERVKGRIITLIVSMHTIKGINPREVLGGIRWASIIFVFITHPYKMDAPQAGRAKESVIVRCLLEVNT
jgi:hypothetical protein